MFNEGQKTSQRGILKRPDFLVSLLALPKEGELIPPLSEGQGDGLKCSDFG